MTARPQLGLFDMQMTAVFSGPDDCYRDQLIRRWDESLPLLVVCMLNPSTADHETNDPTILTLIHFAKLWGFGGLLVVNLCAFRSPSPAVMRAAADPVGPENDKALLNAMMYARASGRILVAWGNDGDFLERGAWFCDRAVNLGLSLICLGTTRSGAPKHPMARGLHRIPRDQQPLPWSPLA
jgi:hypothetical protein